MESLTEDGLTVIYDEDEGIITFDWNEDTHPQYNFLADLTQEKLSEMIIGHCNDYFNKHSEEITKAGEDCSAL
jgi:hypothetical protein